MKQIGARLMFFISTTLLADIEAGKKVYAENCAMCHTANGGSAFGPDFNMVSYTRHKEDIEKYAKDPNSHYKEFGYNANAMPALPLKDKAFKDVAKYIDSLQPFKKWMIKKTPTLSK